VHTVCMLCAYTDIHSMIVSLVLWYCAFFICLHMPVRDHSLGSLVR
jgi:hypothetical protein